jgi:hypothetical protein
VSKVRYRRLIALVAAYAIALQAVVASFAVASAVDVVAGLCTSSAPQTPGPEPWHAQACIGCPAFCGDNGSPAPASGVSVPARHAVAVRFAQGGLLPAERMAPRNLPPARAPPRA